MGLALLPERLRVRIEAAEHADEPRLRRAELGPAACERGGVGRLHRAEAPVAAAIVREGQSAPHPACVTGPRHGVP